jgi:aspartate-semialdehyde dehydrogenase
MGCLFGEPQALKLPARPKQFLHYFEEENRPQTKLDRNLENGMAVSIGRSTRRLRNMITNLFDFPQHPARPQQAAVFAG